MELMSGNEAIAQGAWEAGCRIGVAYPGTPSTETLEAFAQKEGVYAEWCVNEKVAVEVGIGASAAGARVLATMKHVGVNVAADPLFTFSYTGVGGGFVLLAADDPGMYSSQNEQDSRFYAQAACIPCMDPADSAEALTFTKEAYGLSESYDVPFMIRSTVRISHTKTLVETGPRTEVDLIPYEKNPQKWVMMPAFAKPRRTVQLSRIQQLQEWAETCAYNRVIERGKEIGIICAGAVYQHVIEALPDASVFKLGVTWPLPAEALQRFANSVEKVYVVEEGSTYVSQGVKACDITLSEPAHPLSPAGELSPGLIRAAFGVEEPAFTPAPEGLPGRPPALCPGCPHRVVFKELSRMRAIVTGDIGCYTLGALAPLSAMDTTIDMGASVSMAHGFELALKEVDHKPVVAVIGDSTFAHSGVSALMSTIYNGGISTVCVLDNRTTAMTGRQGNPFNGVTLQGRESHELDIEAVVRALGVRDVHTVDSHNVEDVREALKAATRAEEVSVLIFRAPCVLLERKKQKRKWINGSCTGCGVCISIGCPALSKEDSGVALIDPAQCVGCGQCVQYCRFGAIENE
jgi:indolepyruvate ferredoxin oxidoreductase alpha subunit